MVAVVGLGIMVILVMNGIDSGGTSCTRTHVNRSDSGMVVVVVPVVLVMVVVVILVVVLVVVVGSGNGGGPGGLVGLVLVVVLSVVLEVVVCTGRAGGGDGADNLKKPGSKVAETFDRYKMGTTMEEATSQGANWQDLTTDCDKNLKIPDIKPTDMEVQGSRKRGAPEGTPDREADARSKLPSTGLVPRVLAAEVVESGERVGMNAATLSALRSMKWDEIKYGMVEMEQRFPQN